MDMFGTVWFNAPRERLWQAFCDPSLMKQCLPGCERFELTGDDQAVVTAAITVGPVAATFKGKFQLFDVEPPVTCTIAGEADGGAGSFVAVTAKVRFDESPEGTELSYFAEARLGPRLDQRLTKLGSRKIDATVKELAARFLDNVRESLEGDRRMQQMSGQLKGRG